MGMNERIGKFMAKRIYIYIGGIGRVRGACSFFLEPAFAHLISFHFLIFIRVSLFLLSLYGCLSSSFAKRPAPAFLIWPYPPRIYVSFAV